MDLPLDLLRIIGQYTDTEITWMGIWMYDAPPPPNWNTLEYQRKMHEQIADSKTFESYEHLIIILRYFGSTRGINVF